MSIRYDDVRKIILKGIMINGLGQIMVKPEIVGQLEEYFRQQESAKENEQ